jgi:5'-3' exonuclease
MLKDHMDELPENEKNKIASKKMVEFVSKVIQRENDDLANSYVDNVRLGEQGWKDRYYKEKFNVSKKDLPEFM